MKDKYDIIVVGGGIVGAACAAEFHRNGKSVLVIDAGKVGCAATAAGMGHIVIMDDSEAQIQLNRLSRELWLKFVQDHPDRTEYLPCGTLWLAADEEEMQAVHQKAENYQAHDIAVEILDDQSLYRHEPNLAPGMAGGLRVLDDCVVYPTKSTRVLLDGIDLRENSPVRSIEDHRVILANGSSMQAEAIILSAGVHSPDLIAELPIKPRKGHLVITDRYPGFCKHQIVELGYLKSAHKMEKESVAYNIQPRPSGQFLLGSSREFVGLDESINRTLLKRMLSRACEYMPTLKDLKALRTWIGFRPATEDKMPLVGRWPAIEGLYIASGHEGLGITTSLGTAHLLAAEILGSQPAIDPAPYQAMRIMEKSGL